MLVVVIVVVLSTILIAIAIVAVELSIVGTRDLVLGAIGLTAIRSAAHLAPEIFRRLLKEAFFELLDLLTVEQTVELLLLIKSLEERRDRIEGCVF